MRPYRSGSLLAPLCTCDGSGSKVRPLRWHSHQGGAYSARSMAGNERRTLPKILIVHVGAQGGDVAANKAIMPSWLELSFGDSRWERAPSPSGTLWRTRSDC